MQQSPYEAPKRELTGAKDSDTEPRPFQVFLSVMQILIGITGVGMYARMIFTDINTSIIALPFLAVTLLILWSGKMLWQGNRYAWLPVSIITVPLNLIVIPLAASQFILLTDWNHDPLKEKVENPHTVDPRFLIPFVAVSLLLLVCTIYSFMMRNKMQNEATPNK